MHHLDVHVRDLAAARRFFDALMPLVGYGVRSEYDDFVSYWKNGERPSIGIIPDGTIGSGSMRLAFSVAKAGLVDAAAAAVIERGAINVEGPSLHPEYGDDYYAVFFEDPDGNKFEIVVDPAVESA